MIEGFLENHPTLYAVTEPLDRHDLDIPLRRKPVLFTLRIPGNEMSYALCQVLPKLGSVGPSRVADITPQGH